MKKVWRTFKKWFVPHPENDHRAHILRTRSVAVVCIVSVAAELIFLSGFSLPAFRSSLLGDIVVGTLADGTNAARVSNDLPALQTSPLLTLAAQEKANDMAKNNYFAHTSPAGLTPWYWFGNVGYDFTYAGENLAVDFSDSQDVTNAWLNSPEHRANILSANFTQIGIAIATGTFEGQPAVFVAEEFGAPSPLMIAAPTLAAAAAKSEVSSLENLAVAPVVATSTEAPASVLGKTVAVSPPEPTPIAATDVKTASSEQMFVAVKSASTQSIPVVAVVTSSVPNAAPVSVPAANLAPQTNAIEQAIANPRASIDSFYLFIALFFACAIAVDIIVKVRTEHPKMIMGGLVAISLAGIFILLNQSLFLGVIIK